MELGDLGNEFEFDLSDVDVAAFESVASEIPQPSATDPIQEAQVCSHIPLAQEEIEPKIECSSESQQLLPSLLHHQPLSQPYQAQLHHQNQHMQIQSQTQHSPSCLPTAQSTQVFTQAQTFTGDKITYSQTNSIKLVSNPFAQSNQKQILAQAAATSGKILLVPINAKPGSSILPVQSGSNSLTVSSITPNNKKQILQLASYSPSLNASNQVPSSLITYSQSQLLPSTSNTQTNKRPIFITTNTSNYKQHGSSIGLNLNKPINKLQRNNSLPGPFSPKQPSFNESCTKNPSNTIATTNSNELTKRKPCNCTKSQCLKLYCDCFANGEFCNGCNCVNCFNSLPHEKERQQAILQCLERNPQAFHPKIGKALKPVASGEPTPDSIERRHTKGCNCKRSGCLKNYCECYEAKILCSNMCKCCGCKNYEESFERKSLMQLTNSSSDNARGILRSLLPTNNSTRGKDFAKQYITEKVIQASLACLLSTAHQAEIDGLGADEIPVLIETEMGRCLKLIVETASKPLTSTKR